MYVYPLIPTPKPAEAQTADPTRSAKPSNRPALPQQSIAGAYRVANFMLDLLYQQFPAVFKAVQQALNKEFHHDVPLNA